MIWLAIFLCVFCIISCKGNLGGNSSQEETSQTIYSLKMEDAGERPRVIVTTDGETDDKASFLRFL
ncbi:MAG: hypothetical protein EA394_10790, partial [Bacteroidia bacterium]